MGNPWEQMLLVEAKKINVRPKIEAKPFSNGSLKESLLNASFNNDSKHRTVVKDMFNNGSFKEPLLNSYAALLGYGSLF
jgi:hypothetical protein